MSKSSNLVLQQEHYLSEKVTFGDYDILYFTSKSPTKSSELNEDSLGVFQLNKETLVLAIADGAGGHPSGYKASQMAMETLESVFSKKTEGNINSRNLILDAIEMANKKIMESNIGCRTTLTVCCLENKSMRIYQVGDSGALLVGQRGSLKFKTLFQSPVGYGLEAGLIKEEEALTHPDLNQVSNLMGEGEMHIHIGPEISLNPKDTLLLASDGIFDNFNIEQLTDIIRVGKIESVVENLLSSFKEENEKNLKKFDDYSFIVCRLS